MIKFLIIFFTLTPIFAEALDFKIRAREHYSIHDVKIGSETYKYNGLTNTINLWWENPYRFSYGFSFMPILAGIRTEDEDSPFGEKITHQNIGFEAKYFFSKLLYIRPGLGYSRLETTKGNKRNYYGTFTYLGIGVEIPRNSHGLALELAGRRSIYNDDVSIDSITPSIGFHFYKGI